MEKVHLLTLGCPKNLADSELMLGSLVRAGFEITTDAAQAQVLVVNTCAFIEAAKKESLDAIIEAAELKRQLVGRRLVVAGCLAQRYGAELAQEMPEVDVFVGTGNFLDLPELLRRTSCPPRRRCASKPAISSALISRFQRGVTISARSASSQRFEDSTKAARWPIWWRRQKHSRQGVYANSIS